VGHDPARAARLQADHRRATGVFYTPAALADVLAAWAVSPSSRRVFDPSFGQGALLEAAYRRLRQLRVRMAQNRLWGLELDPDAGRRLSAKGLQIPIEHLHAGDFFASSLADFGGEPFDAIVANPPYVRHHLLDALTKQRGRARAREAGIELNERSDAWAYFCAHLTGFLAPEGRLALLLPHSVLHADYALPVLHTLAEGAGHSTLIRIKQHLFPAVIERTVVLLVDHSRTGAGELEYREVADLAGLSELMSPSSPARSRRRSTSGRDPARSHSRLATRLRWHLTREQRAAWEEVCDHPQVTTLADFAVVRIGVVTGANHWFICSLEDALQLGCNHMPIVGRSAWMQGPVWREQDQDAVAGKRSRLLLIGSTDPLTPVLQEAIARGEQEGIDQGHHCSAREKWWSLTDRSIPQFFLPYMGATAPALVLNRAGATCTNAIHRLWLTDGSPAEAAVVSASWTSVWRLSAELVGRSYGGGVLKLEPGECSRLMAPLVLSGAAACLSDLEETCRMRGQAAARELADRLILIDGLGIDPATVKRLQTAVRRLERRRAT
jgi:adenine-specific DNA-methyltransferase